jgi:hypothetical protein
VLQQVKEDWLKELTSEQQASLRTLMAFNCYFSDTVPSLGQCMELLLKGGYAVSIAPEGGDYEVLINREETSLITTADEPVKALWSGLKRFLL